MHQHGAPRSFLVQFLEPVNIGYVARQRLLHCGFFRALEPHDTQSDHEIHHRPQPAVYEGNHERTARLDYKPLSGQETQHQRQECLPDPRKNRREQHGGGKEKVGQAPMQRRLKQQPQQQHEAHEQDCQRVMGSFEVDA